MKGHLSRRLVFVKNTEYGHEIIKRINGENSDFENEAGTDMIYELEDHGMVIDDD